MASVLQRLIKRALSKEQCTEAGKKYRFDVFPDSQLCAGGEEGKDSCNGDSGSGLVLSMMTDSRLMYKVVGLVSNGPLICGTLGVPGLYTKVSKFLPWIRQGAKTLKDNSKVKNT